MLTTLRHGAEAQIRRCPLESGGQDRKTLHHATEQHLQTTPSFQTRRHPPNLSRRSRSEISLYLPPASRRTAHEQSRGTVSPPSGDLPQDMLRNPIGKRTENPQHPSQSGPNRQKKRR